MQPYRLSTALGALVAATTVASAHHSGANYDRSQVITVDGVVTAYDWANPHVYIHVEQTTDAGESIEWAVEGFPPASMRRMGWSERTLQPGDAVTVTGNPTRGPRSHGLYPSTIEAGGRMLFQGSTALQTLASAGAEPEAGATGLDGTWETLAKVELYLYFYNTDMALTEEGGRAHDSYDEATMAPALDCLPYSAPLLMIDPDFKEIVTHGDVITIRGGFAPAERTIHMNVASHDGASPTLQGHSIGRWEGDSLVIDTTQFADHRIGNGYRGVASGRQKHLVERLTLHGDGKRLDYWFELTDPEFLAEPVTGEVEWAYRPDLDFVREPCELDNARQFTSE